MTTLIAVYTSDGCIGRCDANCYEAKGPECDCICGGRNHGKGEPQAIQNTRDLVGLTPEDLERFAKAHNLEPADLVVSNRLQNKRSKHAARNARRELQRREWAAKERERQEADIEGDEA